mmetsp:Transcript_119347/g.237878  ORF Transcript_119347/g.237878 Transcript_119347/m.237878 type:complete len:206 (+) Transcript_119347:1647-2264(+)
MLSNVLRLAIGFPSLSQAPPARSCATSVSKSSCNDDGPPRCARSSNRRPAGCGCGMRPMAAGGVERYRCNNCATRQNNSLDLSGYSCHRGSVWNRRLSNKQPLRSPSPLGSSAQSSERPAAVTSRTARSRPMRPQESNSSVLRKLHSAALQTGSVRMITCSNLKRCVMHTLASEECAEIETPAVAGFSSSNMVGSPEQSCAARAL